VTGRREPRVPRPPKRSRHGNSRGLTVLRVDEDFDIIADITGRPLECPEIG
jgi:hypothetical protein